MECLIEKKEKGAIVLLRGNLIPPDSDQLKTAVKKAFDAGERLVIVDLGEITFVNISGLGALIECLSFAKRKQKTFRIANPTEKIYSLFITTKLATVFPLFDSVDEALNDPI